MHDDPYVDVFDPLRARARRRSAVMWTAIGLSVVIVAVLLLAGLGATAWSIGASVLLLSCFAVCGWSAYQSERDIDVVVEAAKRLAAERQAAEEARRSGQPHHFGA